MANLDELRTQIDQLDKTIMDALDKRFSLMHQIKEAKSKLSAPITQNDREKVVLDKTNLYPFNEAIKTVYLTIIDVSKSLQNG